MALPVLYAKYLTQGNLGCLTSKTEVRNEDVAFLREHGYGKERTDGWIVRIITDEKLADEQRERRWAEEERLLDQLNKEAEEKGDNDEDDSDADDSDADNSDADYGSAEDDIASGSDGD